MIPRERRNHQWDSAIIDFYQGGFVMTTQDQIIGRPMEIMLVEDGLLDARVAIASLKEGLTQHRLTLIRDG